MIYLIHYNYSTGFSMSAKFPTIEDANYFRATFNNLKFLEVGKFSYFLMYFNMPKLAMLSFWE